jgi:hypothetical protein
MMDEYWDSSDQWIEEGVCIVCRTRSEAIVCSAVCSDVLSIRESGRDCGA